jgi:hypothetical protein
VVAVLVRDHVGAGERPALGAEAGLQLAEERQVDVDLVVARAVERSGLRAGAAAAGADPAGEEVRPRRLVALAGAGEGVGPVAVQRVDDRDDLTVQLRVGLGARPAGRGGLRGVRRLPLPDLVQPARERHPATTAASTETAAPAEHIDQEEDDQADDAEPTTTERDPATQRAAAAPAASAAEIVDVRGVEIGVLVEPHSCLLLPGVLTPYGLAADRMGDGRTERPGLCRARDRARKLHLRRRQDVSCS